ncbi:MAG TPA: alpha/beta hydrolase [Vicinamibacteria bacterium]|nr:alpha/beta hydrolase [Vicinamibacteria bacterium]
MKKRLAGLAALLLLAGCFPPEWGANAILHPWRKPLTQKPRRPYQNLSFRGEGGILLKGWLIRSPAPRRGLLVYLHGIGDNRGSGLGLSERLVPQGWDLLLYDSRAQGESEGEACTYGYFEKGDLSKALDAVGAGSAVLFGSSLGASVALQAASVEPRVRGVIAQSAFSDLKTVARERAPFFASRSDVEKALALAEAAGHFPVGEASPQQAAPKVRVPVLLLHGASDRDTPAAHSQRIYEVLPGPKQLILVPGAGHNDALAGEQTWRAIEAWLSSLPADLGS